MTEADSGKFWEPYRVLTEIEAVFKILNDDLRLRPVDHRMLLARWRWELLETAPPSITSAKERVSLPTALWRPGWIRGMMVGIHK
ncbi:MAG: hypothetical protein FJ404_00740 [Verrucomicrobia bacterium]|nr:hypothetical protein [Verrucomicrobiota bacterium]